MNTRSSQPTFTKVLPEGGPEFTSIKIFKNGTLPTKRDVIERALNEPNYLTEKTSRIVATELIDLWVNCNVYTKSVYRVGTMIQNMMNQFGQILRYDKSKIKNPGFVKKKNQLVSGLDAVFDIFCESNTQRKALEKRYGLSMTKNDYDFYEDQKGPRLGKCLNVVEPLTAKDKLFKKRYFDEKEPAKKSEDAPCSSESVQFDPDEIPLSELIRDNLDYSDDENFSTQQFAAKTHDQNRKHWPNLVSAAERYQVSDRVAAAIANAALKDAGYLTETDKQHVIDKNKLRRERAKYRTEIQAEESANYKLVDGIYLDGRKDATLTLFQSTTGKNYHGTVLTEHQVVVGEPGSFYLTHFEPEDGKGATLAKCVFDYVKDTSLFTDLAVVGSDGTSTMTGPHNGFIRSLELLLQRPLQWAICLLHLNELPLRHIFTRLDGTTNSPNAFSGPIGKVLGGNVSDWPVVEFCPIINDNFINLPEDVEDDLSTDQSYAYKIALAVINGTVNEDLSLLEVGPIVHSRWLTLACRILRRYISTPNPSANLMLLAKFCIEVYLPSWFNIKAKNFVTDGSKNYFKLLQSIKTFSDEDIRKAAINVLIRNGYFAHPENILLGMLGDQDLSVRKMAVQVVMKIRMFQSSNPQTEVRKFCVPQINLNAQEFYELADIKIECVEEPPLLRSFSDDEIKNFEVYPLVLRHPCHNQTVERHVKMVTEASSKVATFQRRDGLIRQRIKSRKLMKRFDNKSEYKL